MDLLKCFYEHAGTQHKNFSGSVLKLMTAIKRSLYSCTGTQDCLQEPAAIFLSMLLPVPYRSPVFKPISVLGKHPYWTSTSASTDEGKWARVTLGSSFTSISCSPLCSVFNSSFNPLTSLISCSPEPSYFQVQWTGVPSTLTQALHGISPFSLMSFLFSGSPLSCWGPGSHSASHLPLRFLSFHFLYIESFSTIL